MKVIVAFDISMREGNVIEVENRIRAIHAKVNPDLIMNINSKGVNN